MFQTKQTNSREIRMSTNVIYDYSQGKYLFSGILPGIFRNTTKIRKWIYAKCKINYYHDAWLNHMARDVAILQSEW